MNSTAEPVIWPPSDHPHYERVMLHVEDLRALQACKGRRASRDLLDRLVRVRFIGVNGQCLCTEHARLLVNQARYDGWVHTHHTDLGNLVDTLITPVQRARLIDVAERYQTSIAIKRSATDATFEELRLLQDWLAAPRGRTSR